MKTQPRAQQWTVPTVEQTLLQEPSTYAARIMAYEQAHGDGQPYRVFRSDINRWVPEIEIWVRTSSWNRQRERLAWNRATLFPKYPLLSEFSMLESQNCTLFSHDYRVFLHSARRHGQRRLDQGLGPHQAVLNLLSARYLIVPSEFTPAGCQRLDEADQATPNSALWINLHALPRAWVVHRVDVLPAALAEDDPVAVGRRTQTILFPEGRVRDFRHEAVVEADDSHHFEHLSTPIGPVRSSCRIVEDTPQRVVVEANLDRAGLLVLNDFYHPGWTAEVIAGDHRWSPRIRRTNRIMRGVNLPAGKQRVIFRYRPTRFYLGAAVSAPSWLALAGLMIYGFVFRSDRSPWRHNPSC